MTLSFSHPLLQLRNTTDADMAHLYQIYASTRKEELERATEWTVEQKEAFLLSQFTAQHTYYRNNYSSAYFWVIEVENEIIGRLYLHPNYQGKSIRIIDISILPAFRNKGFGKDILSSIISFAEKLDRPVTIHVESFNPAMQLYLDLGFQLLSTTNGVYHLLEWRPQQKPAHQFNHQAISSEWK